MHEKRGVVVGRGAKHAQDTTTLGPTIRTERGESSGQDGGLICYPGWLCLAY